MIKRQLEWLLQASKWQACQILLFIGRFLNRRIERGQSPRFVAPKNGFDRSRPVVWFFCSTIGELNACKPLIDKFQNDNIVLITDKDCYLEAFQAKYQEAVVVQLQQYGREVADLYSLYPPEKMILCEIPCIPFDAPCRLSYYFLAYLKKKGVKLFVVNGWLYGGEPGCRQDKLEKRWFGKSFLNLFDKVMVQSDDVRSKLIDFGGVPANIVVTGNMKFDALTADGAEGSKIETCDPVFSYFKDATCPIIVAGCVSFSKEVGMVLGAYKELCQKRDLKLIITPRHPENAEKMQAVNASLAQLNKRVAYKSQLGHKMPEEIDVLVLDTYGELSRYYSAADVCFVGANHNLLEPMQYGKPVITSDGWEEIHPSYAVYEEVTKYRLALVAEDQLALKKCVADQLATSDDFCDKIKKGLESLMGATAKNLEIIRLEEAGHLK